VRLLFVGNEEEYAASIAAREDGRPFSLFFCTALSEALEQHHFDALVIPALKFLSAPPRSRYLPLVASGPAELAEPCFESGCSDFIRVPWTESELYARISSHTSRCLTFFQAGIKIAGHRLIGPMAEIALSDDAYSILMLLADNCGRPVPKVAIASLIGIAPQSGRSIDMRIARLRTALRSAGARELADGLRCLHGAYRLNT